MSKIISRSVSTIDKNALRIQLDHAIYGNKKAKESLLYYLDNFLEKKITSPRILLRGFPKTKQLDILFEITKISQLPHIKTFIPYCGYRTEDDMQKLNIELHNLGENLHKKSPCIHSFFELNSLNHECFDRRYYPQRYEISRGKEKYTISLDTQKNIFLNFVNKMQQEQQRIFFLDISTDYGRYKHDNMNQQAEALYDEIVNLKE